MTDQMRESSPNDLTVERHLRWGSPPLALIPTALAREFATVRLPDWLAELLGGTGMAAELNASAWERLPTDGAMRDRIGRHVLNLVTTHAADLRSTPVGGRMGAGPDALSLPLWPARARHALLHLGVDREAALLADVTFGDLLDIPQVGVRTALEAVALLEAFLSYDGDSEPDEGQHVYTTDPPIARLARWGEPGSSLLPQTLRRAFADEALPAWLLHDLHLPDDSTPLSLDSSVWRRIDRLPRRAEQFLLGLATYRAADIRDLRVIHGVWPDNVRPVDVPWPTRVRNRLVLAGLLDPWLLEQLTYGDLFALPAMGVKSVLEFATLADALATVAPTQVLSEEMRHHLLVAAEEDWAELVRADDPRFRDVTPPYEGSLSDLFEGALNDPESPRAHRIAACIAEIRVRVEEVAGEPIDLALARLMRSLGMSSRDVDIVMARFGWSGHRAQSLRAVGANFSMSGERVRQLADKAIARIGPTYLPQIERAMQLLTDHAPLTAETAAQLLVEEHLVSVPMGPTALIAAAEFLGYEVTFQVDPGDGIPFVLARGLAGTGPIFAVARRDAGRVGVSNVEEVQAELGARGEEYPADAISRVLRSSTKVEFLHEDWFWWPTIPPGRNRLRNVTQRMLSVAPRLDVATLRQGVRRRYRFMRIDLVPPVSVLTAFYAANPEFVVCEDGLVESAEPLDYRDALGDVEEVFVEVLRASPTGLMDRAELEEAVTGRGVNASTFAVFTTYSPILDHPATNIWSLRGHTADPAQLEALRAILATRTRQRRPLTYGWDEDGSLRITVELGSVGSPLVSIPRSIAGYVSARHFPARTQEGTAAGVIGVDDGGTSWGYGPFLRRRGAEPGDALTIRFDLVAEKVTLSLDDDDALIEATG